MAGFSCHYSSVLPLLFKHLKIALCSALVVDNSIFLWHSIKLDGILSLTCSLLALFEVCGCRYPSLLLRDVMMESGCVCCGSWQCSQGYYPPLLRRRRLRVPGRATVGVDREARALESNVLHLNWGCYHLQNAAENAGMRDPHSSQHVYALCKLEFPEKALQ